MNPLTPRRRRTPWALPCATLALTILTAAHPPARAADSTATPQPAPAAALPTVAQAEAFMQSGKYPEAVRAYEQVVASDPANAIARVRYGRALLESGDIDKCIEIESQALAMSGVKARACYHLACAYAAKGDTARALEFIDQAVAAGLPNAQILLTEPRLHSIHSEPSFTAAIERLRAANDKPVFHALDFWIGDWDVYDAQGNKVGTNRIESVESGCLIAETWNGSIGDSGRSMNFFVPQTSQWRQVWVNSVGDLLTMDGAVVNGAMWFEGETHSRAGAMRRNRTVLTPLPGARVRQTIHIQQNAQGDWILAFDCIYIPKAQPFSPDQFPKDPPPGAP